MAWDRIFRQEELDEMGALTIDLIERAIDNGDKEQARKLARRLYREASVLHDNYANWVTTLLSFIGRRCGDDDLREAILQVMTPGVERTLQIYEGAELKERVHRLAWLLRVHLQPVERDRAADGGNGAHAREVILGDRARGPVRRVDEAALLRREQAVEAALLRERAPQREGRVAGAAFGQIETGGDNQVGTRCGRVAADAEFLNCARERHIEIVKRVTPQTLRLQKLAQFLA